MLILISIKSHFGVYAENFQSIFPHRELLCQS
jgi:hypothetical protein